MKKMFSLLLSLMMVFGVSMAFSEEAVSFEGKWLQIKDEFEMQVPLDWQEKEVEEQMKEVGVFFDLWSADESKCMQVGHSELGVEVGIEVLQAALQESYPTAQLVSDNGNGIPVLLVADMVNDTLMYVVMDSSSTGYYMFGFVPMSDSDLVSCSAEIMSSLRSAE